MIRKTRMGLLVCGLPVLLVGAALGLTLFLQGIVSTAGFIFFYAAVLASAWFAGPWAGWLSVILASVSAEYFFMAPLHTLGVNRESLPVFLEFASSAVIIGWFSSWRKQAEAGLTQARDQLQTRVEERTAELRQTNQQLVAEIAERKRAQEAFSEAQAELARVTRISALGALAASISHEVNQPLAAVVANADACAMWLSRQPPNLEEARAAVDCVAQEGTRASEVIRRIRAMFSKGAPERTSLQINGLIGEVCGLMRGEAARHQATLETEVAAGLPPVLCDRVQLQQVMMNLMLNGMEAMRSVDDRPRRLLIRSEARRADTGKDEVLVTVRDSGTGFDPQDQRRIFDAFFTTKDHGMGMGLSISHAIIEAHGGRLWATANSDYGATLQFTLPAAGEAS